MLTAASPAPGTVLLITHERKDTIMRKRITLGTAGIAGVVTAGLLALPIASAVTGDDEPVKRDEDAPEVALVDEDDRDDDSADPASRVTRDHSRSPRTHDGQSRDATGATATAGAATGGTRPDVTGSDTAATGHVSGGGNGSHDDVSAATGD